MRTKSRAQDCLWQLAASLLLFGLAFLAPTSLAAQEVTAAINGVVTDPSGSAVSGAKVTAKDLDRGTTYPTTTNSDGAYSLPRLPIGNYELRVENPGFQSAVQSPIVLQLNQVAKVNIQLQVGQCQPDCGGHGCGPHTADGNHAARHGTRCSYQRCLTAGDSQLQSIDLAGAGLCNYRPRRDFTGAQSTFSSGRPYINGNREQANNYILDGMDNNQSIGKRRRFCA